MTNETNVYAQKMDRIGEQGTLKPYSRLQKCTPVKKLSCDFVCFQIPSYFEQLPRDHLPEQQGPPDQTTSPSYTDHCQVLRGLHTRTAFELQVS